jgi:methylphosphotriester-DNA--protein-cysteine methyltransferase
MNDEPDPENKINFVQKFLLQQLRNNLTSQNHIVDYSVKFISSLNGLSTISQLEKKTGYTKRYIDLLFKNHLGISPKTHATIHRFQHFYKFSHSGEKTISTATDIYEMYYDRSPFIKEFKRFTGYSPSQFSKLKNDFGN